MAEGSRGDVTVFVEVGGSLEDRDGESWHG